MLGFIEKIKKRKEFNAENCRKKQQVIEDIDFLQKIDDIKGRIEYVVGNSTKEHAVIYCINPSKYDMYVRIADYFEKKGFITIITEIQGLRDKYLIISWGE